ncbi:mutator type transposase, partial [Tanacetum coccineum]
WLLNSEEGPPKVKVEVEWNGSDLYQVTCPWGDQFVVNLSERVCSCRKWELSGIPCTHAVASIWDQANNGIDTGIPESYWLEETRCVNNHYPTKPHPQIGRPPKKRKKSAAELADEMMKSKKLTKTGKSVTCKSYAAHGSQQAGVHGSQTTQSTPQAS